MYIQQLSHPVSRICCQNFTNISHTHTGYVYIYSYSHNIITQSNINTTYMYISDNSASQDK